MPPYKLIVLALVQSIPMFAQAQWSGKSHSVSQSYTTYSGQKTASIQIDIRIQDILFASIQENGSAFTATVYNADGNPKKTFRKLSEFSEQDRSNYPDLYAMVVKISMAKPEEKEARKNLIVNTLKNHSPRGHSVYDSLKNKGIFDFFSENNLKADLNKITPIDLINASDIAIHEGLHGLDIETGKYVLISGKLISVPTIPNTPNHEVIYEEASAYKNANLDTYIHTYLTGDSGAQNITVLLDELNAYAHGASVKIDLAEGLKTSTSINPGLQSMLVFHGLYLEKLLKTNPAIYSSIKKNKAVQDAFLNLYQQAEATLLRACTSNYGTTEKQILQIAFSDRILNAWSSFLGKDLSQNKKEIQAKCKLVPLKALGPFCPSENHDAKSLVELSDTLSLIKKAI